MDTVRVTYLLSDWVRCISCYEINVRLRVIRGMICNLEWHLKNFLPHSGKWAANRENRDDYNKSHTASILESLQMWGKLFLQAMFGDDCSLLRVIARTPVFLLKWGALSVVCYPGWDFWSCFLEPWARILLHSWLSWLELILRYYGYAAPPTTTWNLLQEARKKKNKRLHHHDNAVTSY